MSWKNWPSWLKGGVVGGGIGIVINIVPIFLIGIFKISEQLFNSILSILGLPWNFIILILFGGGAEIVYFIELFLGNLIGIIINGFIIGALIGFIIGKIKSKNKGRKIKNDKLYKK